jgi:hypothetical protein
MRHIASLPVLLFAGLATALALILPTTAQATTETWVSATGNDNNKETGCQAAAPCATVGVALAQTNPGGTVFCAGPMVVFGPLTISQDVTIDCSQGSAAIPATCTGPADGIDVNTAGVKVTLRGLTIYGVEPGACTSGFIGVHITAAASVRIENCKIFGFSTAGVEVAPGSGNVVVKIQDSTITQNTPGILVAPTGSASVSISIDRSQIENNNGGGVKTNATSGAINASISDSSLSFNADNGLIALGGAGGQNMVNLSHDVIASNGQAGIETSGTNAAALVDTTLLESNTGGALSAVSSGRILTYQNNRIVGSPGTGFTGTASPQ